MTTPKDNRTASDLLAEARAKRPDWRFAKNKADNAIAKWADGRWRTLAALGIDGRWYHATDFNVNGEPAFPQHLWVE